MMINPNYLEEINGSDYVCMTRANPQMTPKLTPVDKISSPTYAPMISVSVPSAAAAAGSPKHATSLSANTNSPSRNNEHQLTSQNLRALQQSQTPTGYEKPACVSPSPSQQSNNSNKRKLFEIHSEEK